MSHKPVKLPAPDTDSSNLLNERIALKLSDDDLFMTDDAAENSRVAGEPFSDSGSRAGRHSLAAEGGGEADRYKVWTWPSVG